MKISHVIRGEEWLTSVPKHILIYKTLGWEIPQLAHVPLILNPDKTKLSKRQGDVATEDLIKKGYLPEALINFIALLGWNPGEGESREIFSLNELIKLFSIERVNSAGAVFNLEKLDWMNSEYIRKYDTERLTELAVPFLNEAGYDTKDKEKAIRVINATRTYINKLEDLKEQAKIFYQDDFKLSDEQIELVLNVSSQKVLSALKNKLEGLAEITLENFKPFIKEIQKETGVRGKELFQPIRLVLTGQDHGPELGVIGYVLGNEEMLRRLNRFRK
jgi:glutamyl-tRNA synthetase